jgi:hypothetical protein
MIKHVKTEIAAIFATLGFRPVDPSEVITDCGPDSTMPQDVIPATFYHAGIDAYFAYAPSIIDGSWDGVLQSLGTIAVIDVEVSAENTQTLDIPLELISVHDLPEFVAQRAFNPAYFDLRIAKRCVAHAQQELSDLDGDERPTRDQYRKAHEALKEALKHLRNLVVPSYQSLTRALQPSLWPVAPLVTNHGTAS